MKHLRALLLALSAAGAISALAMMPHEGLVYTAYQDGIGIWTICRGHTKGVRPGDTATPTQCDAWYIEDVKDAQAVYDRLITHPHHTNVKAAAISFIFNAGAGNFATSTMRKKLNTGDRAGACNEFPRWKYAGGRDCTIRSNNCYGLIKRRQMEKELCLDTHNYSNDPLAFFNVTGGVRPAQLAGQ